MFLIPRWSCLLLAPMILSATVARAGATPLAAPYRLAFITTGTIDATSADIATYNAFVSSSAAATPSLPTVTWRALVSTAAVAAADNVDCPTCAGIPIYLTNGTQLAPSIAAFFANAGMADIAEDAGGNTVFSYVWTGSNLDGTAAPGQTLGSPNPAFMLSSFGFGATSSNTNSNSLFALSNPIGATPIAEPMSAALLLAGLTVAAAGRLSRRSVPEFLRNLTRAQLRVPHGKRNDERPGQQRRANTET